MHFSIQSAMSAIMFIASLSSSLALAPQLALHPQPTLALHASKFVSRHGIVFASELSSELAMVSAPKLKITVPLPEERGKGGVFATETIAPMEVLARIPRNLVLQPAAMTNERALETAGWAAELTAAALTALHAESDSPIKSWIASWRSGGWAYDNADLGPPGVRWGADDVIGNLLATGSDNDENIYAKFRFPCHPVVHRASLGLAALTRSDKKDALAALVVRGFAYRSMRDELIPLVTMPSERAKGSARDKRAWDVSDMCSRVLSRATCLVLDDSGTASCVVVPLHERLEHCADSVGENAKLVGVDPLGSDEVLLVATREILAGEAITRDYATAPRLPEDNSDGALRLLLQFGLPPKAWVADAGWDLIEEENKGPAEGDRCE